MDSAIIEKKGDRVFTPDWVAKDMTEHFKPSGKVLEPFKGGGVFLKYLPDADWCEIEEGVDFFDNNSKYDWIISNPPYSKTRDCFRHSYKVADNIVYLVPLRNIFSGHGFVKEIFEYGGIAEIRVYGTGGSLGFPMGNCVGAIYCKKGYDGQTTWTFPIRPIGV